ncbi:MAG: hypothetical protein ABWY36_08825 [Leifsonia sp.]
MNGFDLWSVTAMTALVIVVASAVFITDTLMRKDDEAGRVWSLAYIAGVLTVLSYLVWVAAPDAWWAVAVGNSMFALSAGCMWLGARIFNGRTRPTWYLVAAGSAAAFVAVIVEGPDGGDWAGAIVMYVTIAAFAAAGGSEAMRGTMKLNPNGRALALVLLLQSAFFIVRLAAFIAVGPDSAFFQTWFGSVAASFVTVVLIIVAAITMSVLRADRTRLRDDAASAVVGYTESGVLLHPSFDRIVNDWLNRMEYTDEQLALVSVRLDDLDAITTAFSHALAVDVAEAWVASIRRSVPTVSDIGEDGFGRLIIATPFATIDDARAAADLLRDGLLDETTTSPNGIRPTVSIGVALTDLHGYSLPTLVGAARAAADEAQREGGDAVVIATDRHSVRES